MAIALFDAGTGGASSHFVWIMLLPVVWIASLPGRVHILYAGGGAFVTLALPYVLIWRLPATTAETVLLTFTPFVVVAAASVVNELSRISRTKVRELENVLHENEKLLERSLEYAVMLQASETKYRDADRMSRGIWAAATEQSVIGTDETGLIDLWNPGATKLLGPGFRATQGIRHIFEFHVMEELEERARELNYPPGATVLNPGFSALVESARLGNAEIREWSYLRDDGDTLPVQLSVTKRVGADGQTIGYLFVASDLTKAKEVARLKDEFVGLISHELRTPLSSVLGYLELLRDDDRYPLMPDQLQYIEVAERNAHRLLRLVGDLLFSAQVESGKFPLEVRDIELDSIILSAVESARPAATSADVDVISVLPDSVSMVRADGVRIGQAVDNLISNALKFTPRGGKVTVSLAFEDDRAVVRVADTGIGIASDELDQLFTRFFRATTATRNVIPGVGLGLTITRAIIIAHHGEMTVTSAEGEGTTFTMALPIEHAAIIQEVRSSAN
ncbi:MAG: HAMP domain-containing histidine kinase [Salinibacterium sp.]|nr:HAMP domain-containing histidine kinase [Salinibacterium sp.]